MPPTDETPIQPPPDPVPLSPSPPPEPRRPAHVAWVHVNETVIYQPPGGQASEPVPHRDGSFTRVLHTEEQPWRRDLAVGPDWAPLDLGWLAGKPVSQLIVINQEGQFRGGNPTPEARAAVLAKVVHVGHDRDGKAAKFTKVSPYQSIRIEPEPDEDYLICCPNGPAKVTVVAIPGDGA